VRVSIILSLSIILGSSVLKAQSTPSDSTWSRADSSVVLGRRHLGLRAYAWRDFMPSPDDSAADGSDLMVRLQVVSLDSLPLPAGLLVDSAWVRSAEGLWLTAPTDESRPDIPNGVDLMLRGGPKWAPGQTADVLVRLRLPSGEALYVRRCQPITETS
jgi:hypothetical protein